jgi:serine/threonine-protein kinase
MGAVYLGRDPELDRKVAIKTVRDQDLEEHQRKRFRERFRNEARAAARLSHPSIVAVYDVGEEEGVGPFLVFEYVPGSTLKQILRSRGALPAADVLAIASQIAAAIDTAHEAGIIHRDVKPDNILVSDDGRAKLADFGVARVPDAPLTREGQFLGTPCYAAPETLTAAKYSPRSDLFSFAAVVYELLCGVRAFPGEDAISVAHAVVHDAPVPPSQAGRAKVPPAVDAIVLRGLSKDPAERYGSALEMVHALEAACVDAGLVEGGAATMPVAPGSARGGGVPFAAVLVGTIVVGGAIVVAMAGGGTASRGDTAIGGTASRGDTAIGGVGAEKRTDAAALGGDVGGPATVHAEGRGADAGPATPRDVGTVGFGALPPAPAERDAGRPPMSRLERENAAKDAIDRARELIRRNELEAAARELARARDLDPESSDLEEVEARLHELRQARP